MMARKVFVVVVLFCFVLFFPFLNVMLNVLTTVLQIYIVQSNQKVCHGN